MTTDDLQNVLAIDSSTSVLKLGLQFQSDRMVKSGEQVEQSHGQMIIRKIDQVNAIVVCTGPGSFTGLRIGLAAAKGIAVANDIPVVGVGIAVANDIPVVGVSLFEIAARKLSQRSAPVMVLVPFIRDEYFCCRVVGGSFQTSDISTVAHSGHDGRGAGGDNRCDLSRRHWGRRQRPQTGINRIRLFGSASAGIGSACRRSARGPLGAGTAIPDEITG